MRIIERDLTWSRSIDEIADKPQKEMTCTISKPSDCSSQYKLGLNKKFEIEFDTSCRSDALYLQVDDPTGGYACRPEGPSCLALWVIPTLVAMWVASLQVSTAKYGTSELSEVARTFSCVHFTFSLFSMWQCAFHPKQSQAQITPTASKNIRGINLNIRGINLKMDQIAF